MVDRTANSIAAVSSSWRCWRWYRIRACAGRCSLAHPCLGSYRARRLTAVPGMPALLGHSIMQWRSRTLGATASGLRSAVEIGVLAGTRCVGLGRLVPGLPLPNDGVVALAETRLPGTVDFVALPVAHSEMYASCRRAP